METPAEVLTWQHEHQRAARLFGAAEALRDTVGASVLAFYRADYDRAIAAARDALGRQPFEALWREGRETTSDGIVSCALREATDTEP